MEIQTEKKTIIKDGIAFEKITGFTINDKNEKEIIYQIEGPVFKPQEPTLSEAEQAAITAALNTEYLVCISELTN